jgi:hypothetical protein
VVFVRFVVRDVVSVVFVVAAILLRTERNDRIDSGRPPGRSENRQSSRHGEHDRDQSERRGIERADAEQRQPDCSWKVTD